jgi:formylglycine-generating enzyme required for sulfatase activity
VVEIVEDFPFVLSLSKHQEPFLSSLLISAGEFFMGSEDGFEDEKPLHRVYLDTFYIDVYEVTNARYGKFIEATKGAGFWTFFERPQEPVMMGWQDADIYCRWAGKRLPTEAEWEKAARGTDGRMYPWGNQWDSKRANTAEGRRGKLAPVGSYGTGKSPFGASDMAGNAWEWVADWYDEKYYLNSPSRNPKGPGTSRWKVMRGGSWYSNEGPARTADRGPRYLVDGWYAGFRCAAEPAAVLPKIQEQTVAEPAAGLDSR